MELGVLVAVDWVAVCKTTDVPRDGGVCALVQGEQIAIFNFTRRGEWYATQNLCPHKQQMVLSRGMIGSTGDTCEPKVACPFHKRTFSLLTGECLNGDECAITTYPVKVEGDQVYVGLSNG
ncbi:nitrite reductase small subunit NirD [Hymenobacter crusticola]|uniref:Nitrite reductase (NAD(P)H) small subunit n=1 Tax=Hymenobacter crusticola TaxID=1770526 RepID=A0A243W7S9_9BACT|nr:nitrite reductase small subunit NirD [Hymenobacter crusticola]OUJ71104.1 nitrite reductase (NAD(P)H) small subunit [Hymenobacter crusticola]